MKIPMYQVDAFTDKIFGGNPAAVCPLKSWLDESTMQNIAAENNLSETAFFLKKGELFELRWFTPAMEVDLCGHATLASAHVLFRHMNYERDEISFSTIKSGELIVAKKGDTLVMDFPAWMPEEMETPHALVKGLGLKPLKTLKTRDCLALLKNEEQVKNLKPDFNALLQLDYLCIIATAPGSEADFVSRVFAPQAGIAEDPVTGSAHSSLIPYWAKALGKNKLNAVQLSKRRGYIECEYRGDRVLIGGKAVTFFKTEIEI